MFGEKVRELAARLPRLPSGPIRYVLASALGVVVLVVLSFGPLVRSRVRSLAAKRGVEVGVGSVSPGWFAVTLGDVDLHLEGVAGVSASLRRIDAGWRGIEIEGGRVTLEGTLADLERDIGAWRERHRSQPSRGSKKKTTHVVANGLAIQWQSEADSLQGSGLAFDIQDDAIRVEVEQMSAAHQGLALEVFQASAEVSRDKKLHAAKANTATVVSRQPPPSAGEKKADPAPADAPFLPLPDLHALRTKIAMVSKLVDAQLAPEGSVDVSELSLRIERGNDQLTAGPGALTFSRRDTTLALEFSTHADASKTALSARVEIPLEHGDARISLSGGPMALAPLGVKEGALGLTDVGRGTVSGKGSVVLSDAGDALTFDVDVAARDISIQGKKLASDVVRGLNLGARARGLLNDGGVLRIDDAEGTLGALHVGGRGTLEQTRDHAAGQLSFTVPVAACQSLLESIPAALLPTIGGSRMVGTFGGRGELAFDSRALDDLTLAYRFDDACKLVEVPADLVRERFKKPFLHRVYAPDGKMMEEETGPGTDAWTEIGAISPYLQVAVLTTEDGGFYRHHGFNHAAIKSSVITNLKARAFVRGASTISMQLAKNLFLTREKTVSRKFEELILTSYLEQNFSKEELMELYLNVIEFGPNLYGITRAADHYFGRKPEEINLAEAFFLSTLLPHPLSSHRMYDKGEVSEGTLRDVKNHWSVKA